MPDSGAPWPFGATDGGPASRPLVVDLHNVLVVVLTDDAAAERAAAALADLGFTPDRLRRYTSAQILAYDEEFRSARGLKGRVVGALVDDAQIMAAYVAYARAGGAALWIRVADRDEANRLVRHLADDDIVHLWFHGADSLESLRMR